MIGTNQMEPPPLPYQIEVVADNLSIPWAVDISQNGDVYFTERTGTVWKIENAGESPQALFTFRAPFVSPGEGGLMGIALDPDFSQNHYIYVMHTYQLGNRIYNRVVRLVEYNGKAVLDQILLDKIPGGLNHNGGRLKIGPDGKLYITTGDAGEPALSQDSSSLAGKILRLELDGTIPQDNPFPGSPVYSLGLRNPQGLAWDTTGKLYATEHGQNAQDEINFIVPRGNYGWPVLKGDEDTGDTGMRKPIISSQNETWAPSGIAFVKEGPWRDKLAVAGLFGKELLVFTLNEDGSAVTNKEIWLADEYGRLREVVQAQDGSLYITTNNRDGRGNAAPDDDKILRLTYNNL